MDYPSSRDRDGFQIDYQQYESPSHAIVIAIAALENSDVTDIAPLYESVDPSALDQLLRHAAGKERQLVVEFAVDDYTVRVRGDGTLEVTDISPELGSS